MNPRHLAPLRLAAVCSVLQLLSFSAPAQTLPAPPASPTPSLGYRYDAQGNLTHLIEAPGVAGFGFTSEQRYDSLQRLKESIDARQGKTWLDYDGQDRITRVTDPRQLFTEYPRNGLGEPQKLISPDTGTARHTYDAAGNLKTVSDAAGVTATYSHDALNRLTAVSYSRAGVASQSYGWAYDQSGAGFSYGAGRLTSATNPWGSSQYAYDAQGRLSRATQVLNPATGANTTPITHNTEYRYDSAGRLQQLVYPSGRVVSYTYSGGQLSALGVAANANATSAPLLSGIEFAPFGAAQSWLWHQSDGSTREHTRVFDTAGRLVRYPLGTLVRDLSYDAAGRITRYTHHDAATGTAQPALDQSFGYDELGRLTSVAIGTSSWSYAYDANGNRTQRVLNGSASISTLAADSNRLTAVTNPARSLSHDALGNVTADNWRGYTATYRDDGRLGSVTKDGVTYTYHHNAFGQRTRKLSSAAGSVTYIFVYDQNGQLLGEYAANGAPIREYVWLGSTPVAVLRPDAANPAGVNYIHADHLDTPRMVLDPSSQLRWQWLGEPFGTTGVNSNPAGLGVFVLPLRFPGQYADSESGLYYNYFRDYEPTLGRYVQSDPIGLSGGSLSTYGYVNGNPLSYSDSIGLCGPFTPFCAWILANTPWLVPTAGVVAETGVMLATGANIPSSAAAVAVTRNAGQICKSVAEETKNLFHYTNKTGMEGILQSKVLLPSLKSLNPKDARYGDGQYLSDILPGTMSCSKLSRCFIGNPFQGQRFTHFVEVDVTGLNVLMGREGVYVIPNQDALDLTARIMSSGRN